MKKNSFPFNFLFCFLFSFFIRLKVQIVPTNEQMNVCGSSYFCFYFHFRDRSSSSGLTLWTEQIDKIIILPYTSDHNTANLYPLWVLKNPSSVSIIKLILFTTPRSFVRVSSSVFALPFPCLGFFFFFFWFRSFALRAIESRRIQMCVERHHRHIGASGGNVSE